MQEAATRKGKKVRFAEGYGPGGHGRAAAGDFAAGAVLREGGTRLTARAMSAAAAAERACIAVARRPRAAIIATGDELAAPGEAHLAAATIPDKIGRASCREGVCQSV